MQSSEKFLPSINYDRAKYLGSHALIGVDPLLEPKGQIIRKFPVILFNHGLKLDRHSLASIFEELATHGFVALSVDHPSIVGSVSLTGDRVIEAVTDSLLCG